MKMPVEKITDESLDEDEWFLDNKEMPEYIEL
ncbi:hypothetical protein SDC9_95765 [bioreactor metagenome]|uniref:Uncharacterized protein n=2 Tax=root TaxID=1 RepID=A0A645A7J6_9ZZZZ